MAILISREAVIAFYDYQVGITRDVDADVALPLSIIEEAIVSVVRVTSDNLKLPHCQLSIHRLTVFAIHDPMFISPPQLLGSDQIFLPLFELKHKLFHLVPPAGQLLILRIIRFARPHLPVV